MTHTEYMSTPIKPGTARRLGLNLPPSKSVLIVRRELTDEEMARLEAVYWRVDKQYRSWFTDEEIARFKSRRRWWQRRNR